MTSRCRSTSSANGTTCVGRLVPGRTLVIYKPLNPDSAEPQASDEQRAPALGHGQRNSKISANRSSQTAKYHKVKKGETLSSIAESNHTSVAALKRDNPNLDANLRAGEVLLIRK